MENLRESQPPRSIGGFLSRLSGYVADALRYWELRRLVYNGVLACVAAIDFFLAWPISRDKLSFDILLGLFILAVVANSLFARSMRSTSSSSSQDWSPPSAGVARRS